MAREIVRGAGGGDSDGDEAGIESGNPESLEERADSSRIDYANVGPTRQPAIDGKLVLPLPAIDAALRGDQVRRLSPARGQAAITVAGKQPGVHDVRLELPDA